MFACALANYFEESDQLKDEVVKLLVGNIPPGKSCHVVLTYVTGKAAKILGSNFFKELRYKDGALQFAIPCTRNLPLSSIVLDVRFKSCIFLFNHLQGNNVSSSFNVNVNMLMPSVITHINSSHLVNTSIDGRIANVKFTASQVPQYCVHMNNIAQSSEMFRLAINTENEHETQSIIEEVMIN